MTECTSETLRDRLPALAQDALGAADAAAVRAHIADCPACAAEFSVIGAARAVYAAATPTVDSAAILRALPAPPRCELRVLRPAAARPRWRPSRSFLAAAASLTLVATLSLTVLRPIFDTAPGVSPTAGLDSGAVDAPVAVATLAASVATAPSVLAGGTDLSELGVDELTALLAELEEMEATIAADPVTWREPVANLPGGN